MAHQPGRKRDRPALGTRDRDVRRGVLGCRRQVLDVDLDAVRSLVRRTGTVTTRGQGPSSLRNRAVNVQPGRGAGSVSVGAVPAVLVPRERVERWVANFGERHGGAELAVAAGALSGTASDGSTFRAALPFARPYAGPAKAAAFAAALAAPEHWGVLLVRKGGFAVARMSGEQFVESKVGQRHVQGRTKAGGQSQQRFARRRDNQARQAYEAAADHAARILAADAVGTELLTVTGGDHAAVDEVLTDHRLRHLRVVGPLLDVPDPRRGVLEQAVADACSAQVEVVNA